MSDGTKIEWTEATWNPVTGCSVTSPGCTNCYAMKLAGTRLQHHPSRAGLTIDSKAGPVWNGKVRFNDEWLDQPLRWKRPRMIFVCAHGDLFHESVPDAWIDRVFAVMALCPQHTFQVLTKRSARMREYVGDPQTRFRIADQQRTIQKERGINIYVHWATDGDLDDPEEEFRPNWPLPNIWLGVSVEDQQRADERIPDLLATPAAVRWISAEPLLGPIDLANLTAGGLSGERFRRHALAGAWQVEERDHLRCGTMPKLDWIVAGGESGPGARPMHPDWARSLRDQCKAAGVPFFWKQWGEWAPCEGDMPVRVGELPMMRVGKKRAGRLLDGALHDAMPVQ